MEKHLHIVGPACLAVAVLSVLACGILLGTGATGTGIPRVAAYVGIGAGLAAILILAAPINRRR